MSIGLPSGALSWLSVTLGVATGGAGASFRRQRASERDGQATPRASTTVAEARDHEQRWLLTRSKQW